MRKKCLALFCLLLCSCTVTTTSGGKRVVKNPLDYLNETTKTAEETLETVDGLTKANNEAPNPEDAYVKASPDANIVLELKSNWDKTKFFIDSQEMGVGRSFFVKINGNEHTVVAAPEGCESKEESIRPPYNHQVPLRFTFLIGECNKSQVVVQSRVAKKPTRKRKHSSTRR